MDYEEAIKNEFDVLIAKIEKMDQQQIEIGFTYPLEILVNFSFNKLDVISVSYTHLDVYKRQLIRYFQPQYNIQFKDSFPSTNLKVLNDCYKKDIRSLVAEIHFDSFPYQLYSDHVSMNSGHMAHFDLHSDQDRKSFFSAFREL